MPQVGRDAMKMPRAPLLSVRHDMLRIGERHGRADKCGTYERDGQGDRGSSGFLDVTHDDFSSVVTQEHDGHWKVAAIDGSSGRRASVLLRDWMPTRAEWFEEIDALAANINYPLKN